MNLRDLFMKCPLIVGQIVVFACNHICCGSNCPQFTLFRTRTPKFHSRTFSRVHSSCARQPKTMVCVGQGRHMLHIILIPRKRRGILMASVISQSRGTHRSRPISPSGPAGMRCTTRRALQSMFPSPTRISSATMSHWLPLSHPHPAQRRRHEHRIPALPSVPPTRPSAATVSSTAGGASCSTPPTQRAALVRRRCVCEGV